MKPSTHLIHALRSVLMCDIRKNGWLRKCVGASVASLFGLSSIAQADQTWDGGAGTGNWNTAANWGADALPNTASPLIFAGNVQLLTNNDLTAVTSGITFDAAAGAFTLNGGAVTNTGAGLINNSGNLQTVNLGITLGGNQTWQTTGAGGLTVAGAVGLGANTLTTAAAAGDITLSGVVSGIGVIGITHNAGRLVLLGANTYFGNTVVAGGTVQVGDGVAAGSSPGTGSVLVQPAGTLAVNLANGGTLNNAVVTAPGAIVQGINGIGTTQYIDDVISNGGSLRQTGAGTTVLRQANTYTGGTIINSGTLQVGDGAAAGLPGQNIGTNAISVENDGALMLSNVFGGILNNNILNNVAGTVGSLLLGSNSTTELTGTLTDGAGILHVDQYGSGISILSNAGNTYSADTIVEGGTLQIGKTGVGGSIGAGSAVFVSYGGTLSIVNIGGPVANTLANNIDNDGFAGLGTVLVNSANTNTLSGNLTNTTGTLALTQSGAGTTILNGVGNTYTGATTITAGTLQLGQGGVNGGLAAASTIVNNGTLVFDGAAQTYANTISGTGNLVKQQSNVTTLSGNNTYTGLTTISAGTLRVGSATALGSATATGGTVITAGATLDLNEQNIGAEPIQVQGVGVGGLGAIQNNAAGAGVASGPVALTGDTTIGTADGPITLGGVISGAFGLTKVGPDTLTLNGVNTYGGTTSVDAGILVVGNNNALGSSAAGTTVAAGASLSLANGVTVTGESLTLSVVGAGGAGALTQATGGTSSYDGNIILAADAAIRSNGGTLNLLNSSGVNAVNITGSTLALLGNYSPGESININSSILGDSGLFDSDVYIEGTLVNFNSVNNYHGTTTILDNGLPFTTELNANVLGALPGSTDVNQNDRTDIQMFGSILNIRASQYISSLFSVDSTSTVNIGNNQELTIGFNTAAVPPNGADNANYEGVIAGAGGLTKDGTSRQVLSGINTFMGDVSILGGTLALDGGQAIMDSVNVSSAAAGTLELLSSETIASLSGSGDTTLNANTLTTGGNGASTTYSGDMSGVGGGLEKNGAGTFTLSGNNTYTGTTALNTGVINMLGSHVGGGNYAIAAATTLAGTGNITLAPGASFLNSSIISVGNANIAPIGQILTLGTSGGGVVNMAAGSVLAVDILNGNMMGNNAVAGNGSSDNLNLIGVMDATAGGMLVIGNPNGLVGFRGGDAWLLVNNNTGTGGTITGTLGLDDTPLNLTQTQVGNFNQVSGVYTVIDTITGLQMANIQGQSVLQAAQGMLTDVNSRLFYLRSGYGQRGYLDSIQANLDLGVVPGEGDMVDSGAQEWHSYVNANYTHTSIDAIGGQQAGFEADSWTGGVGFERSLNASFTAGFAVDWMTSQQDYTGGVGSLDMSSIALSAYGSYVKKDFWADLLYSFGYHNVETDRDPIGFPIAHGETNALTHTVQFNTGWNFRFQNNSLVTGPFAGIDYMHASVDGYSETSGGLAALRYNSRNYDSLVTRLGWSVSKKFDTDFAKITAQLRLAYERQNMSYDGQTNVNLINQPFTALSRQQDIGQDYMALGLGVHFQFNPRLGMLLNYQGQFFRSSVSSHYFGLRFNYTF